MEFFPFDDQTCELMFASWSHSVDELDLQMEPNAFTMKRKLDGKIAFNENEEWYLLEQQMTRQEVY